MRMLELECLLAVAAEGNLARAAAKLHRSPSSVSRQLKSLEERLGVVLVSRERARVQLTSAGWVAHAYARSLTDDFRYLTAAVRGSAQAALQELCLGVSTSVPPVFVERLTTSLRREFEQVVEVSVRFGSSRSMKAAAERGDVDFALIHSLDEEAPPTRWIHTYAWTVAMAVDHPFGARVHLTAEDLRNSALALPPDAGAARSVMSFLERSSIDANPWPTRTASEAVLLLAQGSHVMPILHPGYLGWSAAFAQTAFRALPLRGKAPALHCVLVQSPAWNMRNSEPLLSRATATMGDRPFQV